MRFFVLAFMISITAGCTRTNPSHCVDSFCVDNTMPDLGWPNIGPMPPGGSTDMGAGAGDLPPPITSHRLDLLFMIDNSASMTTMQAELQARFAGFLQPLEAMATSGSSLDVNIGVVTSDYGAGSVAAINGCQASPGGQRGLLQAVGGAAPATCRAPVGSPFIHFGSHNGVITSNAPAGQDIVATFTCMASVGANGCGFEHQLESVFAALHNTQENAGFLRDDALLAVVFLTNEDDGSAPPTTDIYDPDMTKTGQLGAYDTYRQTRFGIACGTPLMLPPEMASGGPLSSCEAAPNNGFQVIGQEYDVSRYVQFLTRPRSEGGIKSDPRDVVLIAIDAPETPVTIRFVGPGTGNGQPPNPAYVECAMGQTGCVVRVDHSCQNHAQPQFFGDPSLRLNTVVRSASSYQITSICGDNLDAKPDYSGALRTLTDVIHQRFGP
jgi:hypothetical protein